MISLDGGDVFNEAVEAQYHQAKQQQLTEKLEVQHLHIAMLEIVETWGTASVLYKLGEERKFICLLAKDLAEGIGVLGLSKIG